MLMGNSPLIIFKLLLLVTSLILNLVAFRCHPCTCRKQQCIVFPLFLCGNVLTLFLHLPDLVAAFGVFVPSSDSSCSFTFISSSLLCSYFVALGVLRWVLTIPGLNSHRPFFFSSLVFTPLIAAAIQIFYSQAAVEEPLIIQLLVALPYSGPRKEIVIPMVTCAKNLCGSSDVVLTVLTSLVPSLIPIISFSISFLTSYSVRKRERKKAREDYAASRAIHRFCDREFHTWQVLKFVLLLFFGWTIFAKPLTLILTYFTRFYTSQRGLDETTVFMCSNFSDLGNIAILFISASLTPLFFIVSHRSTCRHEKVHSDAKSSLSLIYRPDSLIGGSMADMEIGTFMWDTFQTSRAYQSSENRNEKSLSLN